MFKVGDKVKIVNSMYGESYIGKVGYITRWDQSVGGWGMVATNIDFPDHYCDNFGGFHLNFSANHIEQVEDTKGLALFDWADK